MVNKNYLLVAQNLNERNKNRLNTERSPKEQETDELFYWMMSRLEWSMQNCFPARKSHSVTVKEGFCFDKNSVLLEHGRVSEYLSQYVKKEEFYMVIKDVAEAFNEIGKVMKSEGSFHAVYYAVEGNVELTVVMTTK